MNPLNSILLEGNVVRDAIAKETPKGTQICNFSVAANRSYKNDAGEYDQEVSFFNVESWGKLASWCEKNCIKGRGVRVVGRLKQGRWTDNEGKTREKVQIVAEHVEFKPILKKEHDVIEVADNELEKEETESETIYAEAVF